MPHKNKKPEIAAREGQTAHLVFLQRLKLGLRGGRGQALLGRVGRARAPAPVALGQLAQEESREGGKEGVSGTGAGVAPWPAKKKKDGALPRPSPPSPASDSQAAAP